MIENNVPEKREQIVEEISRLDSYVDTLLNPYGNYVVQKALEYASESLRSKMLAVIKKNLKEERFRTGDFGRKIASKLAKTYPILEEH